MALIWFLLDFFTPLLAAQPVPALGSGADDDYWEFGISPRGVPLKEI
jgi:hypothetical protein